MHLCKLFGSLNIGLRLVFSFGVYKWRPNVVSGAKYLIFVSSRSLKTRGDKNRYFARRYLGLFMSKYLISDRKQCSRGPKNCFSGLLTRLGILGSLGPRRKVIRHGRSVRMLPVIPYT